MEERKTIFLAINFPIHILLITSKGVTACKRVKNMRGEREALERISSGRKVGRIETALRLDGACIGSWDLPFAKITIGLLYHPRRQ